MKQSRKPVISPTLPAPIAACFAADRAASSDPVADCFTDDAIVKDEGRTHKGKAENRSWKADLSTKFSYTNTPTAVEERDGKIIVTCHLSGNFPGGKIDLRHFFVVEGDRIAFLEIIP